MTKQGYIKFRLKRDEHDTQGNRTHSTVCALGGSLPMTENTHQKLMLDIVAHSLTLTTQSGDEWLACADRGFLVSADGSYFKCKTK